MSESVNLAAWVVWGGFGLALILGFVAAKTNFCTMGAISDVVNMDHRGRARMWLLAIAVAMLDTNLLRVLLPLGIPDREVPRHR